jgi:Uma2 family endonuclease
MITKISQLDLTKTYTYADYLTWKLNERVELFKGFIMKMSPASSSSHQIYSGRLSYLLMQFLRKSSCQVFAAPFDVRLINKRKSTADKEITTVVQPDISVICDPQKIDERGCLGSPDLIIEIVSKGNTKKELENKFELYQENGVKEYWVVQQGDETVVVFDLVRGKYQYRKIYSNDGIIPVKVIKGLEIDLKEVFEN